MPRNTHLGGRLSQYGLVMGRDWRAGYFNSNCAPVGENLLDPFHAHWINYQCDVRNINVFELVPVLVSVKDYYHSWKNQHVVGFSDNPQVVSCINKGTSANPYCMSMLRDIFGA